MFRSAEHKTFWPSAGEIAITVSLSIFSMLLVRSLFKVTGLASADFNTDMPILGVTANLWLQSHGLTLGQTLTSPFEVMQLLIIIGGAPFVEELVFRWFFCRSCASDANGNILPGGRGLGIVLAGSFIFFGYVHGHGYFSILMQGVIGLWLARLFFVNGPNVKTAYFSCVAAHSLYNIYVVANEWLKNS